ncbi:MAG: LD-carboxypeptidase [bacterium]
MKIEVLTPARWIDHALFDAFNSLLAAHGHSVSAPSSCFVQQGQLAGRDDIRHQALQKALDTSPADILWAGRGGYGAMRLLPWLRPAAQAKILIGYSDICTLMFGALGHNITSIHGAMPVDLATKGSDNILAALELAGQVHQSGKGQERHHTLQSLTSGDIQAPVYAVNLAVLSALIGTPWQPDLPNHILCIEDVGEYKYALDRLFWRLAHSALAPKIKGLVLGGFTDLEDNEIAWGAEPADMARHYFKDIPIASHLPIGHGQENKPLLQGETGQLMVRPNTANLTLTGLSG